MLISNTNLTHIFGPEQNMEIRSARITLKTIAPGQTAQKIRGDMEYPSKTGFTIMWPLRLPCC